MGGRCTIHRCIWGRSGALVGAIHPKTFPMQLGGLASYIGSSSATFHLSETPMRIPTQLSRRRFAAGLAVTGLGQLASPAFAQGSSFPSKPLKLIVPFPPGGQTDALGRALGQYIGKELGQPVIVDNLPGANTHIGLDRVLREPADGYTMMIGGSSSFVMNPLLMKDLKYDPKKDIRLLHLVSDMPMMMVVPVDHPAKSVKDFVALAKASPGKLSFGSTGPGGPVHLATELFARTAGIQLTHVPYKGSAPATADLLGGRIDVLFDGPTSTLPHVKAGKLDALAVTSSKRIEIAPDIPSYTEVGLKDMDITSWQGIVAPARTPREVIDTLNAEFNRALQSPDVIARLKEQGVTPVGGSADHFGSFIRKENARWSALAKQVDFKPSAR